MFDAVGIPGGSTSDAWDFFDLMRIAALGRVLNGDGGSSNRQKRAPAWGSIPLGPQPDFDSQFDSHRDGLTATIRTRADYEVQALQWF
jgi:hypothetical protein